MVSARRTLPARLRMRLDAIGALILGTCVAVIGVALATMSTAHAADDVMTPKHVAKLGGVVSSAISPDGKQVAYVRAVPREVGKEDSGSSWTELYVVDESGKSRPYITGKTSVRGVKWTPDGKGIAFLAKRSDDKQTSLYIIPVAGGEARKVLEHKTGISSYSWSHDGKKIAFLARKEGDKKREALKKKGLIPKVYEEDWLPNLVWIAPINTDGSPAAEDQKPKSLELPGHAASVGWSPAGPKLIVALAPTSLVDDSYMKRRLHVVHAETGKIEASLENPGKLGAAVFSPDGKHVAFITGADKNDPKEGRLWVKPAKGGNHVDVLPDYMGHVAHFAWLDNDKILYVGDVGAETVVGSVGRDGQNNKTLLAAGERVWSSLSVNRKPLAVALNASTWQHPGEAFLWRPGRADPKRLTDTNPWLSKLKLAKQEIVKHKAEDGLELQGILIRPLNEEAGKRYPLILTVHGGPESHVKNGWVTRYAYPGQVAAARGFAVFYPNYRGSTGRGVKYSKMGQADAAGKEFSDLIDAVDHLIEIGLVDKAKVGITGGSYGGYASAWGATYYSHRFAASCMFVGISDNISKVGTTDIPIEMYMVHHLKWLWDDWKYFLERSPIYHIKKAKTPILILHGEEDPRVHPSQSLELYRNLKTRGGVPVRLVLYPGEGHGNRKSGARYDYNLRVLRWMEHYLKGTGGEMPPRDLDYDLEEPKKKDEVTEADGDRKKV